VSRCRYCHNAVCCPVVPPRDAGTSVLTQRRQAGQVRDDGSAWMTQNRVAKGSMKYRYVRKRAHIRGAKRPPDIR